MSPLANLPTGAAAIFWGVLTFSILVVLHEGGHFLAARAFGVKVHEFMLGLPGPALRWRSKRSGVVYGVTAIPLGGYVRIAGMEPGSEDELLGRALGLLVDRGRIDSADLASELAIPTDRASALLATLEDYRAAETVEGWPESRPVVQREAGEDDAALLARVRSSVYRGQASWKRIAILAMGVLVNLATAVLVFTVVLSAFGLPVPSDKPVVGSVQSGSAAAVAGLRPGDVVLTIEGARISALGAAAGEDRRIPAGPDRPCRHLPERRAGQRERDARRSHRHPHCRVPRRRPGRGARATPGARRGEDELWLHRPHVRGDRATSSTPPSSPHRSATLAASSGSPTRWPARPKPGRSSTRGWWRCCRCLSAS